MPLEIPLGGADCELVICNAAGNQVGFRRIADEHSDVDALDLQVEWPMIKAREISSRSASVSARLERLRSAGLMPPVSDRIPWTDE